MLILTRRLGEKIIINENISLLVMDVKGCQVRLGIEAPSDVSVHRQEIFLKVKAEQDALMQGNPHTNVTLAETFRAHQQTH